MGVGPQTEDQWRLAEALALEKLHGDDAPGFIAERIGSLAVAGDYAGVERMHEIASAFEKLMTRWRPLN